MVSIDREQQRKDREAHRQEMVQYLLQAGSFKAASDAERRRVNIMLLGLTDARVQTVTGENGTWHRVLVGPFSSRSKLQKAKATLINKGIDTLQIQLKSKP